MHPRMALRCSRLNLGTAMKLNGNIKGPLYQHREGAQGGHIQIPRSLDAARSSEHLNAFGSNNISSKYISSLLHTCFTVNS
ncbi:Protein of unknown function [Pyronema omphalodes CBS 100304]|uniref:Uncharacterized protein n=1 Tax=Pyronema omphalodes (strain CBS 100304) TaxID=1076935 RepID=U4LE85_PYROM|nr:Protein of unknown function [Pyronema omphalodes CBS 100304]